MSNVENASNEASQIPVESITNNGNLNQNETKPTLATFSGNTNDDIVDLNNTQQQQQQQQVTNKSTDTLFKTTAKFTVMPDFFRNHWDPLSSGDWDAEKLSTTCVHRIKKDIFNLYQDPAPGICAIPDENDVSKIHALITGPFDTPYEGGFFYFLIRCPPNYPFKPPRVRLMTTSNGTVRFNPNLYKNGKVCLSILGTWDGPAWLPSQSISSLLMSIQSLMNMAPYFNEPGHEKERQPNASKYYNEIIKHETIRVAVCENLENENLVPKLLHEVMTSSFLEYYDYYLETCKSNLRKDNEQMNDLLFGEKRGNFKYGELLKRLEKIKEKLDNDLNKEDLDNVSKSSSMDEDDGDKKN